jgi:hypothetical protein
LADPLCLLVNPQIEIAIIFVNLRDSTIGQARTGNALSDSHLQNNNAAKILKLIATIHSCEVERWHEAVQSMLAYFATAQLQYQMRLKKLLANAYSKQG